MSENVYYWQKVIGSEPIKIDIRKLKEAAEDSFKNEKSDSYKQKLVYDLL
jgi:hypothetical protein